MDRNRDNEQSFRDDANLNARLHSELHSVAVPEGLHARLLERLRNESQQPIADETLKRDPVLSEHGAVYDGRDTAEGKTDAILSEQQPEPGTESVVEGNSNGAGKFSRRRLGHLALAIAASLLLAAGGWSWWQRGLSAEKLGAFCAKELTNIVNIPDWQQARELPPEIEAFALNHLTLSQPSKAEQTSFDAAVFGSNGTVWRLADRRGELYVFIFEQPASVTGVGKQLRMIQDSGTWNSAACYAAGRMFVVASSEDVRQFFKAPAFA